MKFEAKVVGDIVIISMSGKIMGGDKTTQCRGQLHSYIKDNKNRFLMDMGDVEWINSQGLGMLIACYVSVKKTGGNMVLTRIDNIRKMLEMTSLIGVFDCYNTVEEAMESFDVK